MTRLYISGPVTGINDDNRLAFSWAQNRLMDAGYEPFIPHEIVEPDDTHETAMLLCVNERAHPEARHQVPRSGIRRRGPPPRLGAVGGRAP